MRHRGGPHLSFDTPRPNFDLILQSGGELKEQIFRPNISLAQKIGIVCLLEPYFHTLLPSKLTLNYSKHVFSGVKSIWPLQNRSDGLRWQKSDEKHSCKDFTSLFGLLEPCFQMLLVKILSLMTLQYVWGINSRYQVYLASVRKVRWPQKPTPSLVKRQQNEDKAKLPNIET